jgi:hypothetical protein
LPLFFTGAARGLGALESFRPARVDAFFAELFFAELFFAKTFFAKIGDPFGRHEGAAAST